MLKDMTEGRPLHLMLRFSVPMLLANALQLCYTLADSVVVGRMLGVEAFAAVGATASSHWLVLSVVLGLTQGFGIVFAQRFGAKDTDGLRRAFASACWLSGFLGLFIGIAGVPGSRVLLQLLGTPSGLLDTASIYLGFLLGGMPVTFAYNLLGSLLRALGDSKTPLRAMIFSSVLNIALDIALVIPFGIAGVAAASLLAQLAACAYCWLVIRKSGVLKGRLKWDNASSRELLRLSLPLGFRNAVIEMGGLLVQRYINAYGVEFVAGIAAAKRMYSLLLIAAGAVEAAAGTFIAQNFGAGAKDRVRQGVSAGRGLMLVSSAAIMVFTLLTGRWILGLFIGGDSGQAALVLDAGVKQLNIMALGLPVLYMLFLYRSVIQGIGRPFIPMLSGFFELACRVVSVLFVTPFWGEWGVLLSDVSGWAAAAALLFGSYMLAYRKRVLDAVKIK